MMRMSKTLHTTAAPDEVVSVMLDNTVNPPDMTMAPVYEAEGPEGTVYEWAFTALGTTHRGVMVITEYVPGERLTFRNFGAMESTATMTFEPEDEGTKVSILVASRMTTPVIGRFLDPVLRRGMLENIEWMIQQVEMRTAKKEVATTSA